MINTTLRKSLLGLLVISSLLAKSQNVAINTSGTTAVSGAILDLSNNLTPGTTAFLAPYVTLTSATVLAPVTGAGPAGLLVYNTSASLLNGLNGAGYYYWTGAAWAFLSTGASSTVNSVTGTAPIFATPTTGNVVVSLQGTAGTVFYGTGGGSNFTAVGTSGQFLESQGAGAPIWATTSSVGTKNIAPTGNNVVAVGNGTNQVVNTALGNVSLDVVGTDGGVLYGTGPSSNFTAAGTAGQFLTSTGAGAPTWSNTSSVGTKNIGPVAGSSVIVNNGTNQVVNTALGNVSLDVQGISGGVYYGTGVGTSAKFNAAGTAGQFLISTGAGAPTWSNTSSVGTKNIATAGNGVINVGNGTSQVVNTALGNVSLDVVGTDGGVMYGTGPSSNFTAAGTAGQFLISTGAGAPTWSNTSSVGTKNIGPGAGSSVVVTNGTSQVVNTALGNVSLDVQGTSGGVYYGTGFGTAATFNAAGTTGQILESKGAAAPVWANPNALLTTYNMTATGNNVVHISAGANEVVTANTTFDVVGTNGGVMYGTGASSNFTPVGTTGQLLISQGAAAPIWSNTSSVGTKNIAPTGNNVVVVTNGTNQVVNTALGNVSLDVAGTAGAVMYGTGASSNFNAAGTTGQILESKGAAAPVWAAPNSLLTTYSMSPTGNNVVHISVGANQVVSANTTFDVVGTAGTVMYGTGASSNFNAVGTTGQILESQGAAAPVWVNASTLSAITANNGAYMSSGSNVQFGTNPLVQNTTLPLGTFTLLETSNVSGPYNLNFAHQVQNSNSGGTALAGINTAPYSVGQVGVGIYGQSSQANGYGIYGINNGGVGIYGTGLTYGVEGVAAGSVGVLGTGTTGTEGSGTAYGIYGIGPVAVYGDANSSINSSGGSFGNNAGSCYTYAAYYNGTQYYGIYSNSEIYSSSTKSTLVQDKNGDTRAMYCDESPEVIFHDYGTSSLVNGKIHIDLDPILAKNVAINDKHPLRVIITMNDECPNSLYVTNRTATGFDVVEMNHGTSNASFTYEVIANRADKIVKKGEQEKKYSDMRFPIFKVPPPPAQVDDKNKK